MSFKKYDIIFFAPNVAGLGAMEVVSNLLMAISNNRITKNLKIKVYLPKTNFWLKNPDFNSNWEIVYRLRFKNKLLRLILRGLETFFFGYFLPPTKNLVILGDFPLRGSFNQTVLLHNVNLLADKKQINGIYAFHRFFFKLNLSFVSKWFVQTINIKNKLISMRPELHESVIPLYMPVNKIFENTQISRITPSNTKLKLFYPASFYSHKNHKLFLDIVNSNSFFKVSKVEFKLTIDKQQLFNNSSNNQIEVTNISFLGTLDLNQILHHYSDSNALFFPSLNESYGLPLVEAMKLGLFIICSDLPFTRDICGSEAIYFNPNDPESAIEAIFIAQKRLELGLFPNWENALRKVPNSWDEYANQFLKHLLN